MVFLHIYRAICSFSMSVLLVLNVNIPAIRVIDQSCGFGLIFSVILDGEGVKQKKDRGGGQLFQIFLPKWGDYLRVAINRETAIIQGFTVIHNRKTLNIPQ